MKWGRNKIDKFPETDSEVTNSVVAKNRAVRHSDDTHVTPPLYDTPMAGCPVTQDQQDACGVVRVIPGYVGGLVGNRGERENLRNVDKYCKLLTEGNGKDCNTSGCARLEQ